jgi:hypothetical protein
VKEARRKPRLFSSLLPHLQNLQVGARGASLRGADECVRPTQTSSSFLTSCSNLGCEISTLAACTSDLGDGSRPMVTMVSECSESKAYPDERKRAHIVGIPANDRCSRLGSGHQPACGHGGYASGICPEEWEGMEKFENIAFRFVDRWPFLLVHGRPSDG